jgi:glycosyltransferase involved in cell wall biosynthesis
MKACIVSLARFPNKDAAAVRFLTFSAILQKQSFDITLLGIGDTKYKTPIDYYGYKMVSLRSNSRKDVFSKIISHLFLQQKVLNYVRKYCSDFDLFIVDVSLFSKRTIRFFNTLQSNKHCKVIYDAVEFPSPSEKSFGLSFQTYQRLLSFYSSFKSDDGSAIAISTYLHRFFDSKGISNIVVPAITMASQFDVSLYRPRSVCGKTTFIYCGHPGKKDLVGSLIDAALQLSIDYRSKALFIFIGFDENFAKKCSRLFRCSANDVSCFRFIPFVQHDNINSYYSTSDFSMLLRPGNARYAAAGFPTKVTESLSFGVPIITNLTSDLGLYLRHGDNALEIKDDSLDSVTKSFELAISLSNEKLIEMHKSALQTQKTQLSDSAYSSKLIAFINKC